MMNLREERQAAQLTQEQLAKKCGVTANTIYSWETGRTKPAPDALKKLSKALSAVEAVPKTQTKPKTNGKSMRNQAMKAAFEKNYGGEPRLAKTHPTPAKTNEDRSEALAFDATYLARLVATTVLNPQLRMHTTELLVAAKTTGLTIDRLLDIIVPLAHNPTP